MLISRHKLILILFSGNGRQAATRSLRIPGDINHFL